MEVLGHFFLRKKVDKSRQLKFALEIFTNLLASTEKSIKHLPSLNFGELQMQ